MKFELADERYIDFSIIRIKVTRKEIEELLKDNVIGHTNKVSNKTVLIELAE